jgi:zinc/manganese transport system substrate-binding protein
MHYHYQINNRVLQFIGGHIMAKQKEIAKLNRREFMIQLGGSTAALSLLMLFPVLGTGCSSGENDDESTSIVVTYSVLGSIIRELVGDKAKLTVSIPNGLDPHEWAPSAKDIEAINHASLVIENGLGLEEGMEDTLDTARDNGVNFFTCSDQITIRYVGTGEGIPSGDPDQAVGAADPHLWMDPIAIKEIVSTLSIRLMTDYNLDVSGKAADLENRLDDLTAEVTEMVSVIPEGNRKLVTGHESMGYFANRFGFTLIGAIIPSLSSQAEVSASELAELAQLIEENDVKAIFTEIGTSTAVAEAISEETGVQVVELTTHTLPDDGSYFTFLRNIASIITSSLE